LNSLDEEATLMDHPLVIAWAAAVLARAGIVVITQELLASINDLSARVDARKPVTLDELEELFAELAAIPGYAQFAARQLH
jgi:hypothetical protein